jgi:transposase
VKAYSLDLRTRIVEAYNNQEGSQRQLAKRFKVSLSFVQKLLKQYRVKGTLTPLDRGKGFPPKLAQHQALIEQLVADKNDATLEELQRSIEEKTGININQSNISWFLKKLKLTLKKTCKATQAATERVQKLRVEYWQTVGGIKPEDLIFIDEMGMNLALSRLYARSLQGTRAYRIKPYYPGEHMTLIGAMALTGFLGGMTLDGGTNGQAFRVFVEKILVPSLWPGAYVVMDNLPAHKVQGIRASD